MNEIVPKKDKFEKRLSEIERLQNEGDKPICLKNFETQTGLLNLFQKKITGAEMNEYSVYLGETLNEFNKKINKFYLEFKGVYGALESLDKEYLAGIVGAYNEAVQAFKKAEKAQADIDKTLDYLKIAVEKIGEFNKKVSSELAKIDPESWKIETTKHQEEIDEINTKVISIIQTIEDYKSEHANLMQKLDDCQKELEKYKNEKKRTNKMSLLCGIVTGVAVITMVALVFLIKFGII